MRHPPRASRPHMPGYGILGPNEGSGLLPWSWAEDRLARARAYWLSTVRPDAAPHAMPVWGAWFADALWLSSGRRSRHARNLLAEPRCVVTTDDPAEPVILEGRAEIVTDVTLIEGFLAVHNAKYDTSLDLAFQDPAVNATVRVVPVTAFGLIEADFTGSPTRWVFGRGASIR
ncbi:MAG: pyridoxamine 5'-phosphate oxidase family protein [Candidatus Limnocylindria bacterium]